jgi:hypothetical protein
MSYQAQISNYQSTYGEPLRHVYTPAEYATLRKYNVYDDAYVGAPPASTTAVTIVPSYGGVGYKTLQHKLPSEIFSANAGYFRLNQAYPFKTDFSNYLTG